MMMEGYSIRYETFITSDEKFVFNRRIWQGTPRGLLPHISERVQNYRVVHGSKYAREANRLAEQQMKASKS